jgi:hypothetical protein
MRDSNLISSEGRGPLNFGEREALKTQHRNRNISTASYAEDQAAHRRALEVDMTKKAWPRITWESLPAAEKFPYASGKFR